MSPVLALFVEPLQCTNSGAIGGTADVPGTLRAYPSDANDPQETCAGDRLLMCKQAIEPICRRPAQPEVHGGRPAGAGTCV